jgi:hypothetical protein
MRALDKRRLTPAAVTKALAKLSSDRDFDAATTRSTADELVVQSRVRIASAVFGGL